MIEYFYFSSTIVKFFLPREAACGHVCPPFLGSRSVSITCYSDQGVLRAASLTDYWEYFGSVPELGNARVLMSPYAV